MLDLVVVTILTLGLAGFLIGLVVMKVKHDTAFLAESNDRADALIARAKQWRESGTPHSLPVQNAPKPAIRPVQ